ncbi:MAG: MerR family transcriptional regulator [Methylocystaceae bacterium]
MKIYRTSQAASLADIHPNTVRLYEELGYLPPVPRAANGYRIYHQLHIEHLLLIRSAFRSTWLGGAIRQQALQVITQAAAGDITKALASARKHLALITSEREKAELAAEYLETWADIEHNGPETMSCRKVGDAVKHLDITHDMLRSWERNGLILIPRNSQNGYREIGEEQIRRLYLIRALRKARFSLMSIYHMLQYYDRGGRDRLTGILNELAPDEEDIFFNTDQWLTKINSIETSAREVMNRLYSIEKLL